MSLESSRLGRLLESGRAGPELDRCRCSDFTQGRGLSKLDDVSRGSEGWGMDTSANKVDSPLLLSAMDGRLLEGRSVVGGVLTAKLTAGFVDCVKGGCSTPCSCTAGEIESGESDDG